MSKTEWFRRSTWTDQDRQEFNARLARSRASSSKSQYLRIQASHLADAGLHAAAIELLDRLLADYPEKIEIASAHLQKANSLRILGQTGLVIDEFRAALHAERDFPNVKTGTWLDFGWFVVEHQRADLYDEVLEIFKEFRDESDLKFPATEYRYWGVQAVIAAAQANPVAAREFAQRALGEASKTHSGLRYHANLGLVGSQPAWLEKKLQALAGS